VAARAVFRSQRFERQQLLMPESEPKMWCDRFPSAVASAFRPGRFDVTAGTIRVQSPGQHVAAIRFSLHSDCGKVNDSLKSHAIYFQATAYKRSHYASFARVVLGSDAKASRWIYLICPADLTLASQSGCKSGECTHPRSMNIYPCA
jgi:hypothetical protein